MGNSIWQYIQDHAPAIATIFFFLFFCHIVYSVFKKGQEQKFDDYSKIPFKDDIKIESDKNSLESDKSLSNQNKLKNDN